MHPKIPTLSLLPSLGDTETKELYCSTIERKINRALLVDVAPDREELLTSNKTIEDIRKSLKLRVSSEYGHWPEKREVKVKNEPTRLSTLVPVDENPVGGTPEALTSIRLLPPVNSRVLSNSSGRHSTNDAAAGLAGETGQGKLSIWSSGGLSTLEELISPRPLGPTHILVVYATPPPTLSEGCHALKPVRPKRRKTTAPPPPNSELLELPINDLLFVLNVPNLMPPNKYPALSALPRRLHKEMPKVLMHVPHLETFPELVSYLHTKNQAALFRSIIPEWMRDIMHPLPRMASSGASTCSTRRTITRSTGRVRKFISKLVAGSTSASRLDSVGPSTNTDELVKSYYTIGVEIAEAASEFEFEEDPVLAAATLLEALRDNLNHIGYYARDLWDELNACRHIIRQAISHGARVTDSDVVE